MLIKDVLQKTTLFFRDKGFASARLDTEILLAKALQWNRMKLYLNYEYPLNEQELTACRDLVRRRASGEPVAYITGEKDFYNHTFAVKPGVLIPRPETETLVETILAWSAGHKSEEGQFKLIDLGSGSGCIGLSVLAGVDNSSLLAVDSSPVAAQVTSENALKMDLGERVTVLNCRAEELESSQVESIFGRLADAVVANPPYIAENDLEVEANVRKFEPAEALFSGEDGLLHIRSWAVTVSQVLRPGGVAMFEIGHQQGAKACAIFSSLAEFENVELIRDLAGVDRFVRCFRREEH